MPHPDEPVVSKLGAHELNQVIERAIVAEPRVPVPPGVRYRLPVVPLGDEVGRGVDPLDLAAQFEFEFSAADPEQGEFNAG